MVVSEGLQGSGYRGSRYDPGCTCHPVGLSGLCNWGIWGLWVQGSAGRVGRGGESWGSSGGLAEMGDGGQAGLGAGGVCWSDGPESRRPLEGAPRQRPHYRLHLVKECKSQAGPGGLHLGPAGRDQSALRCRPASPQAAVWLWQSSCHRTAALSPLKSVQVLQVVPGGQEY